MAGEILDLFLYFDFLFAKILSLTKNESENFKLERNARVVFYSAYLTSESEFQIIQKHVKDELQNFDTTYLINSGEYTPTLESNLPLIVINRENRGRDFGSLRYAIQNAGKSLQEVKELLILNDSVYWKAGALKQYVARAQNSEFTVTGLTSSYQHEYHLQSFALHFKGVNNLTLKVLNNIYSFQAKRTIVKFGEKRLSRRLEKLGIHIGSLFDPHIMQLNVNNFSSWYGKDVDAILSLVGQGVPLNPSIHYWPELALSAGVIKKSLFRNPANFSQPPNNNEKLMELMSGWGFQLP
jgi:hypothetical protein